MKRFLYFMVIALACMMSLASCSKSPSDMIVGKFRVTDIQSDQSMSDEERMVWNEVVENLKQNSSCEHKSDHSLISILNGIEQHGTWELLGDDLQLQYTLEDKSVVTSNIKELAGDYFILSNFDPVSKTTTLITYTKE